MSLGILGKKLGMTRLFDEESQAMIPVTVVEVGGNTILQTKTVESDGYNAVQVGYNDQKEQRVAKPLLGHFKKHGSAPKQWVKEFRFAEGEALPTEHPGAELFTAGQWIDVIGVTKGKGFQGVVKRHGFAGGPRSHGQKHSEREPGSIGSTGPQRVFKGMRMAGRMGADRVTVSNLEVLAVDPVAGVLVISGAIPGRRGTLVEIKK